MERSHEVLVARQDAETLAGASIPHPNILVVTTTHDSVCVLAELDACETAVVALELAQALASCKVPELDEGVAGSRDDVGAANGNGVDGAAVALELAHQLPRRPVPDADGSVFGAGDDVGVVEADVEDTRRVVRQARERHVAGERPYYAGVVRGPRDENLFIELEAEHRGGVEVLRRLKGGGWGRRQDLCTFPRLDVPDPDCAVAGASDDFGVVELDAVDAVGVAREVLVAHLGL